ncbi:MAG TPA: RNA helicase, partial [Treponema sp.]|nr:RNA helicase [Treponema sp.]
NWAQPSLDRFSIISNSDAHSPDKIGREATIFETEMSYDGLYRAIFPRSQTSAANIAATIEFFPEEGKYHYDGHRKCGVCVNPGADNFRVAVCPVCGKPLTRGVMGRVTELAGRPLEKTKKPVTRGNRRPFYSLIPLREILGELL